MSDELTDAEVDFLLERFDQTEPALQRHIIAALVKKNFELVEENKQLREDVKRKDGLLVKYRLGRL